MNVIDEIIQEQREAVFNMGECFTRHFYHKPKFLDWLQKYSNGQPVIELGAGMLDFSKALHQKGIPVIAVEPRARVGLYGMHILPTLADKVARSMDGLFIAARPDHSGWVTEIPELISGKSSFLYVGLEKNLEDDFPSSEFNHDLVYSDAGEDGENVWEVIVK